jgi:hypothetical protein
MKDQIKLAERINNYMRKDIKALNEAYLKATSSINEQVGGRVRNSNIIHYK